MVALLEGYLGYSLVDDLLSGMGLAIGNASRSRSRSSARASVPSSGAGRSRAERVLPAHVHRARVPAPGADRGAARRPPALVALRAPHAVPAAAAQTERRIVGVPTFPGQAPRSLGLLLAVAGVLVLLGGLVQINPIWLWGPFHTYSSTNGAQPDWYLGWLIGALRLMPGLDSTIGDYTLVPNPFWGGVALPARRLRLPLPLAAGSSGASRAIGRSTTCSTGRATRPAARPSASGC